jgi:AraC family transcriptional regulator of adaptative response / DNA-3-methyladenine glycosylase II
MECVTQLRALPGIGEWTAQYIAMREMREPDAFPAGDVGLLRALTDAEGVRPTSRELLARAERWRPWRAYAAQHLWASGMPPAHAQPRQRDPCQSKISDLNPSREGVNEARRSVGA